MSKVSDTPKQSFWNFDNLPYQLFLLATGILPFIFLPFVSIPTDVIKKLVFFILILLALICWLIKRWEHGTLVVPKSAILVSLGALVVVSVVSALLSGAPIHSLVGFMFEQGTVIALFILVLTVFLGSMVLQSKTRLLSLYLTIFGSAAIVFVFQFVKWLGSLLIYKTPFFTTPAVNLIGKWNSLGIFSGLVILLGLIAVERLPLREVTWIRKSLWILIGAGLVVALVVNFYPVWIVLAVLSAILVAYSQLRREPESPRKIIQPSLAFLIIAIVLIIFSRAGAPISSGIQYVQDKAHISVLEVRPSFKSTMLVARETIKDTPILGVGPNKFTEAWLKHKPTGVNLSNFWNANFDVGSGSIPSDVISLGLLGGLAWLAFLASLLWSGRKLLPKNDDITSEVLVLMSFIGAVYLWTFLVIYPADIVVYTLAFILTGVFLASLVEAELIPVGSWSIARNPRYGFLSSILLVVVIIVGVGGGYILIQKMWSYTTFLRGIKVASSQLDVAESLIIKANAQSEADVYLRAIVDINLLKLGQLVQAGDQAKLEADAKPIHEQAKTSAEKALAYNSSNYINWLYLGRVYEILVPLGVNDAYPAALEAYQKALALNPSPAIYLDLARLELARKDETKARGYIGEALKVKSNFTSAIFLLAQLEAQKGNLPGAIKEAEKAVGVAPSDMGAWFQLGFLKYRSGDYDGAAESFEKAVQINRIYANAKYFLGLSYDKLGRRADALKQFEEIKLTNADNQELAQIISNLKAGKPALTDTAPPEPDKRDEPPIKER